MVDRPTRDQDQEEKRRVVLSPITGKPLHESRIPGVVIGPEEEPEEMDDDITGPDDSYAPPAQRSSTGVQYIAHIEDPDDEEEVDRLVATLREKLGFNEG